MAIPSLSSVSAHLPPLAAIYLAAAFSLGIVIRSLRGYFLVFSALCLLGTLCHELLHFLCGLFSNAKPAGMTIIPARVGSTYVLGSVSFNNVRWYNGWFVGLAPLLLFPCAYYLAIYQTQSGLQFHAWNAFAFYLTAQLLLAGLPSRQDMKVAVTSSWWLFIVLGAVVWKSF